MTDDTIPDDFNLWWAFYGRYQYFTIQEEALMIVAAKAAWDARPCFRAQPVVGDLLRLTHQ